MSILTAYVSLAIFPLASLLVFNPVGLSWEIKRGPAPMPAETIEKAETVGRYMLFVIDAFVLVPLLALVWGYEIRFAWLGLRLQRPYFDLLVGFSVAICWVSYQRILLYLTPAMKASLATHYKQKGSAFFWVLAFLIGAFAEEFWLAFCLFALKQAGYSVPLSVALTAAAFAIAHAKMGFGALHQVICGITQALIFVWLDSLLIIYCIHLFYNLGGLYWIRRARYRLS